MFGAVFVLRDGKLIPKHLAPPLNEKYAEGPAIIGDCIPVTLNPANGKQYDSKSAYYKAVRAAGCEILGSKEEPSANARPQLDDPMSDIVKSMQQIKSRASAPRKRKRKK